MKNVKKDNSKPTLPLEWPEDEKVMEKLVMDVLRTFKYGKYLFIPVGTIEKGVYLSWYSSL